MADVYLDYQSSTPVLPEVFEAMRPFFIGQFASPSAIHRRGLEVRDALAAARSQVAALVNAASPEEIIFTSSGTESANLAVKGAALAAKGRGNHVVLSAIEHPAVLQSAEFLGALGFRLTKLPVDPAGIVDPEAVRTAIEDRTVLICVQQANADIGTVQRLREIASIAGEAGVPLFIDAAASGGWLPLDVQSLPPCLVSLAPHRFYGPKGVGILYRNRRCRLTSLVQGGVQEHGYHAGTENVPGIIGAGAAAEAARLAMVERSARVLRLQRRLLRHVRRDIPHIRLNGPEPGPARLPHQLNISFEFVEGEGLALKLDMLGVAVASGPSCVSRSMKVSHVLEAIGLPNHLARSNLLLSLGIHHSEAEIDEAAVALVQATEALRALSPLWADFKKGLVPPSTPERETAPDSAA